MRIENDIIKSPKVSIIITFYNLGSYIRNCIESILNQTYQNFEIIIVNDGSDEKNSSVLKTLINNNKIKILNLEKNEGQLNAFLKGLELSEGEFILMTDADDILLPDYIKTLLYIHMNYNTAFVSSSCGEINEKNEIISLNYISNKCDNKIKNVNFKEIEKIFNTNEEFEIKILNTKNTPYALWSWNPSSSAMIRKSALEILKYYPDKKYWKTGADKVIFSLLHLVGGSINTNAVLWLYRHHNSNSSQTNITTGDKKYLKEEYVQKIVNWNIKLRLDTVIMFIQNKKELISKYNKLNYYKMLLRVIFCINLTVCTKIFKTLVHKIF